MLLSNHELPVSGAGDDPEEYEYYSHSPRYLNTRIRLLNDSILSFKISNEIQLETIHQGFLSTIKRRKELLEKIQQLNEQCQYLHKQNQLIKEKNQNRLDENKKLENYYQELIQQEKAKQKQSRK